MIKTKIKRILAAIGLGLLLAARLSYSVPAQTVTQAYNADQQLERGMIVRQKKDEPTKVEPLTGDTADKMHGVVVNPNDAPVTLSAEGRTFFVATGGHFEMLVSNQNGPIGPGDYVSISALPGIGMKADQNQPVIAGKALGSFDGTANTVSKIELKDAGGSRSVSVGRMEVDIDISRNPLQKATDSNLPGILKKVSEAIANKPVNAPRVYLSLSVFVATALVSGSILYAGVRSSITAIGRNPLSKKSITRSLIQVILTSLIIFISGTFGVYLLLKL